MLLQWGNLLEHLTVLQNIRAAQALATNPASDGPKTLVEWVGLEHRLNARPSSLSGGESARAGLAVALANDPPVLLADEPTGEVDRATEEKLLETIAAAIADSVREELLVERVRVRVRKPGIAWAEWTAVTVERP